MTTPTSRDVLNHTSIEELKDRIQELEAEEATYLLLLNLDALARSLVELQEFFEQEETNAPSARIHPNH